MHMCLEIQSDLPIMYFTHSYFHKMSKLLNCNYLITQKCRCMKTRNQFFTTFARANLRFQISWTLIRENSNHHWSLFHLKRFVLQIWRMCQAPYLSELDFSNSPVWNFQFDELDFFPSLNWIFVGYTGSKNPVQTGKKYQFIKLEISNWRIWKIQFR